MTKEEFIEKMSYDSMKTKEKIQTNEEYKFLKEETSLNKINFTDYFKQNNFKDLFQKASITLQHTQNRDESLASFFKLVTEASLKRIFKANRMFDFLSELENFLNNDLFNDHEKKSFFNGKINLCLMYSLNVKNFTLSKTINKYRKNREISDFYEYIAKKIKEEEYTILDNLFEITDSITVNHSQVLRMFYSNGCRNFAQIKYFIEKYGFDINGLGTAPGIYNKYAFSHTVFEKDGTNGSIFFEQFINEFNNKIDFDIQGVDSQKAKRNLLEILIHSKLENPIKLNRLTIILKNCALSEKHIAYIVQYLVDENNDIIIKYYDSEVYDALFAHEKFNSSLYDREAFLNKLLMMDNSAKFYHARFIANFTINPTSAILNKFIKNAKSPVPMAQHPLITWVKMQNENFSKDTLKSLMTFYSNELPSFDFKDAKINNVLGKALKDNGMNLPEKKGWFSFFQWNKKTNTIVPSSTLSNANEPKKPIDKLEFNNMLFEQVKDGDIRRYIESIILNAEQFDMLVTNKYDIENVHYMHNLLPKFLNKTIDNYLHFSTMEEENAKNNVVVQLKLINKKTFEVLSQSLENEKNQIIRDGTIHHKVMQNY